MTSVAIYNDTSTGYARKYTYRQTVIDRLKLLDEYEGLTDEQVFDLQCTNALGVITYSIFDDSLLPADIVFEFSSYDHGLAAFVEDGAQKIVVVDSYIADYLAGLTDSDISAEPGTDVTDNASVSQLKTLRAGQLETRHAYCLNMVVELHGKFHWKIYHDAMLWQALITPVIADLDDYPVFKEFVITDNATTAGALTTTDADDSATRAVTENNDYYIFCASVHGFYHEMLRAIQAAATTGALLAIDTMDIITHAESL